MKPVNESDFYLPLADFESLREYLATILDGELARDRKTLVTIAERIYDRGVGMGLQWLDDWAPALRLTSTEWIALLTPVVVAESEAENEQE